MFLTWNKQTWTSSGKLLNVIGQMNVILVATAYIISKSLFNHNPSSLDNTSSVLNSFRLRISASGSQNSFMKETSTGIHSASAPTSGPSISSILCWSITSLVSVQRTKKKAFRVTLNSLSSIFGISWRHGFLKRK